MDEVHCFVEIDEMADVSAKKIRQIKEFICVKPGSRDKRHIPLELRQCLPGTECSAPQGLAQLMTRGASCNIVTSLSLTSVYQ